jgi:hypothetical protein
MPVKSTDLKKRSFFGLLGSLPYKQTIKLYLHIFQVSLNGDGMHVVRCLCIMMRVSKPE